MTVALILILSIVSVGLLLWLSERRWRAANSLPETEPAQPAAEECCGMHITCEKDSLLAAVSKNIEYYDDEELDRFAGRTPDDYDEAETEEFRDVLLTMQADEIAGWARSLQLRGVALPAPVRDELIMMVAEARNSRITTRSDVAVS